MRRTIHSSEESEPGNRRTLTNQLDHSREDGWIEIKPIREQHLELHNTHGTCQWRRRQDCDDRCIIHAKSTDCNNFVSWSFFL